MSSKYAASTGSLVGDNVEIACARVFSLNAADEGAASSKAETAFCLLSKEMCE